MYLGISLIQFSWSMLPNVKKIITTTIIVTITITITITTMTMTMTMTMAMTMIMIMIIIMIIVIIFIQDNLFSVISTGIKGGPVIKILQ